MFEFLFEIVGEFLLQLVLEMLLQMGLHAMVEPLDIKPNPYRAALGYLLLGALFGGLSLLLFPHYLVSNHGLRIANLIVTPIAVGLCMAMRGKWRARRQQPVLRIDRFAYGFCFALGLALVRFLAAD